MRKKIFWLIHDLSVGGAERTTVDFLSMFADAGYETTLFLVKRSGAFLERLDPRVRVVSPDVSSLRNALYPLAAALRAVRPDLIFSNLTHLNIAAISLSRILNLDAKVYAFEHSSPSLNNACSLKEKLLSAVAAYAYRQAARILAVSDGAAADIARTMRLPRSRISVIYNPLDLAYLEAAARESSGVPAVDRAEKPMIVAVGRFEPAKNFAFLLRAFRLVRDRFDSRLILIGDGSEAVSLRELTRTLDLADSVFFPGFCENPYAFMARANVLACSSVYEGFNRTIAEALALGVPVVSVDCPSGPAEILADGAFGRLTPPGDLDAFAAALTEALAPVSEFERDRLRKRGAEFSLPKIFSSLERVLNETD